MNFDADRPIERREQDRLGRASLAEAIAEQIRAIDAEHGFTVALRGGWGSGKTSLLNMVAETLEQGEDPPAVLRFNPWLFSGAADLMPRFFRELSAQLDESQLPGLKEVAKGLTTLGQILAPLSPVPGTAMAMEVAAQQVDQWREAPSLHEEHRRLRGALSKSGRRIIVLIDDIDRLNPGEVRELIRLVRLTSDLPNLIFVLVFDRQRVAESLAEDELEGQRYLDKIVQVSHDLPTLRESVLSKTLTTLLDEVIQDYEVTELERDVWFRVFHEVIKPLVGNLRDVKRYLYSLPATLDAVGEEVALADLLALEALRVLRPAAFEDLRAHAPYLVEADPWALLPKQQGKEKLSAMLEQAGQDGEVLKAVLDILFPTTSGSMHYGSGWNSTWKKRRRVACADVLRIYFQAGLDEGALAAHEVQQLVEALTDEGRLVQLLGPLDSGRLEAAFERLEEFEHDYPKEAAPIAVPILLNQMGRLSGKFTGSLSFSPRLKATRVIYRLLGRVDEETLANNVDEMLGRVDSLSGKLHLVELVGHRESVGHEMISESDARILEDGLVEQLKAVTVEELTEEWELFNLVVRPLLWLDPDDRARLVARLQEHLDNDEFVVALLRAAVSYTYHSDGRSEKRIPWDFLAETIGEGLASAVDRVVRSLLYQSLPEEDQDTLELAQNYASGALPEESGKRQ